MIEACVESLACLPVNLRVGAVEAAFSNAVQVGTGEEEVGMFQRFGNETVNVGDGHGNS